MVRYSIIQHFHVLLCLTPKKEFPVLDTNSGLSMDFDFLWRHVYPLAQIVKTWLYHWHQVWVNGFDKTCRPTTRSPQKLSDDLESDNVLCLSEHVLHIYLLMDMKFDLPWILYYCIWHEVATVWPYGLSITWERDHEHARAHIHTHTHIHTLTLYITPQRAFGWFRHHNQLVGCVP